MPSTEWEELSLGDYVHIMDAARKVQSVWCTREDHTYASVVRIGITGLLLRIEMTGCDYNQPCSGTHRYWRSVS